MAGEEDEEEMQEEEGRGRGAVEPEVAQTVSYLCHSSVRGASWTMGNKNKRVVVI